jgi:hypothetical protein
MQIIVVLIVVFTILFIAGAVPMVIFAFKRGDCVNSCVNGKCSFTGKCVPPNL